MNTEKLADALAQQTGVAPYKVRQIITQMPRVIAAAVKNGEVVDFGNFGTFFQKAYARRRRMNVVTGVINELPGHRKMKFKMARAWERAGGLQ
jgi:nucleoid DNA-binding protein